MVLGELLKMADLLGIQAWLSKNYEKVGNYAGKWIAVSGTGVEQSAGSLKALSAKLSEQQKSAFLLTRIPTKREAANLIF